jgi:hypothetical protein
MASTAPHLSPHLIARSLDDLRTWQLPDAADFVNAHRGLLKALMATEALASLELPVDMRALALNDASEVNQWDAVASLLAQAEGTLRGTAHRHRIARLHQIFPGHATQLERLRRQAAERLRRLRARVDFVCQGPGEAAAATEPTHAARSSLLQ